MNKLRYTKSLFFLILGISLSLILWSEFINWNATTCACIIFGQSNAVGIGDTSKVTDKSVIYRRPNVFIYNVNNFGGTNGELELLYPGINSNNEGKGWFGLETPISDYLLNTSSCDSVYIFKIAYSASSLGGAWAPGTRIRRDLKFGFHDFLEELKSRKINPVWKAIVWMQGESDARQTLDRAKEYNTNLVEFMNWFRYTTSLNEETISIIRIHKNPSEQPYQDFVRTAQQTFVSEHVNYLLIDSDDIPRQGNSNPNVSLHYTSDGYIILGERIAIRNRWSWLPKVIFNLIFK